MEAWLQRQLRRERTLSEESIRIDLTPTGLLMESECIDYPDDLLVALIASTYATHRTTKDKNMLHCQLG